MKWVNMYADNMKQFLLQKRKQFTIHNSSKICGIDSLRQRNTLKSCGMNSVLIIVVKRLSKSLYNLPIQQCKNRVFSFNVLCKSDRWSQIKNVLSFVKVTAFISRINPVCPNLDHLLLWFSMALKTALEFGPVWSCSFEHIQCFIPVLLE